jgi:hypothetical protein
VDRAEDQIEDHDQAELHGVDAEADRGRHEDRDQISNAASASMKQPTTSRITFDASRNTGGEWILRPSRGERLRNARDRHAPADAPAP